MKRFLFILLCVSFAEAQPYYPFRTTIYWPDSTTNGLNTIVWRKYNDSTKAWVNVGWTNPQQFNVKFQIRGTTDMSANVSTSLGVLNKRADSTYSEIGVAGSYAFANVRRRSGSASSVVWQAYYDSVLFRIAGVDKFKLNSSGNYSFFGGNFTSIGSITATGDITTNGNLKLSGSGTYPDLWLYDDISTSGWKIAQNGSDDLTFTYAGGATYSPFHLGITASNEGAYFGVAASQAGRLWFYNASNGNLVSLKSGITSASYTMVLPTAQGSANQFLVNDGSGNLSWRTNGLGMDSLQTSTGAVTFFKYSSPILSFGDVSNNSKSAWMLGYNSTSSLALGSSVATLLGGTGGLQLDANGATVTGNWFPLTTDIYDNGTQSLFWRRTRTDSLSNPRTALNVADSLNIVASGVLQMGGVTTIDASRNASLGTLASTTTTITGATTITTSANALKINDNSGTGIQNVLFVQMSATADPTNSPMQLFQANDGGGTLRTLGGIRFTSTDTTTNAVTGSWNIQPNKSGSASGGLVGGFVNGVNWVNVGSTLNSNSGNFGADTLIYDNNIKPSGVSVEAYGVGVVNDTLNWTTQTGTIAAQNFANTATAHLYRFAYYLHTTTASGSGSPTITITVSYNNGGSKTQTSGTLDLATANAELSGQFVFYVNSGTPTWSTTLAASSGTPQYAIRASLERVW